MMRQLGSNDAEREAISIPPWNVVLKSLREASGVTQEGWAAHLGYGRRTVQRWEHGNIPPDAAATEALVRLCAERALYRTYRQGALAGLTMSAELLREVLSDARLRQRVRTPVLHHRAPDGLRSVLDVVLDLPLARKPAHNLPVEITSFVGREELLSDIARLLDRSLLVTLTGTGGVGKTRLALRVASGLVSSFADGVWLVTLDTVEDPAHVSQAVAAAVGISQQRGQPIEVTLEEHVRNRRLLIVMDNCEHVIESCATLAARLLSASKGLRILATSREPLGVPGEVVVRVPSLTVPEGDSTYRVEDLVATEAVQLFVERAKASNPEFEQTAQNAESVVQICRRLDGNPLSIELAAGWIRVLTPKEIDTRLSDRFRLLSGGSRVTPARHQTLQAAIDWSYNLLSLDERRLFDRLSVFTGPFSLSAIEAVCAWDDLGDALDLLAHLVEKSLVAATTRANGDDTEYRLLETLRAYAEQRLRHRNEYDELRRRHAMWMCNLAGQIPSAIHGPDQRRWLQWIARDEANIRAALNWAFDQQRATLALRMVTALWWPWGALGRPREVRTWLERVLTMPASDSIDYQRLRAQALSYLGTVNVLQGDLAAARPLLEEATAVATLLGDEPTILVVHAGLALLKVGAGSDDAVSEAETALKLARRLEDDWVEARLLEMQAQATLRRGDTEAAVRLLEQGVRIARRAGDTWGLAQLLGNLGDAARSSGRHAQAQALYEECLSLRASLGIPGIAPNVRHNLGYVALAERDSSGVRDRFLEALQEFERAGDRRGVAECLIGLAGVAAVAGDALKATTLFGAAESALESMGAHIWPSNQADYERLVAMVRAKLTETEFATTRASGRSLSLERAIQLAISEFPEDHPKRLETRESRTLENLP